jgi:hypothetical protein
MKKIVFKNEDNSIGIITPTEEALSFASIQQIAEKDVPHNLPYWIAEESVIPTDRTNRSAWQLDGSEGNPHGFGGESNEFDAELLANYLQGAIG